MWNQSPYSMAASEMLPSAWLMKWLSRYEKSTKPQARRTCRTPIARRNFSKLKRLVALIKFGSPRFCTIAAFQNPCQQEFEEGSAPARRDCRSQSHATPKCDQLFLTR
jgi:hypothetical protein